MNDNSERLMHLLRGGTCERPPYFEPWFAMRGMLAERYGDSYITMAQDLGHAAMPLGSINPNTTFMNRVPATAAGASYAGGALTDPQQLRDQPMPDLDAQREAMVAYREEIRDAGFACWLVLGWCFDRIAASMGLEGLAMNVYDNPQFVHDAMHWVEQRNKLVIEKIVEPLRPDFVLYNGDCAYKTGPMIAPQMIREFCWEPTTATVAAIRDLDIPFAFHTDGKLDDIIPMLLDLGICAVHGCEKQANDLGHLADTFGDKIALCGNMDVVFLTYATPRAVREETLTMLEVGNRKGRFIAGCNTSPLDYIPFENYQAFVTTVRDWEGSAAR